ncbi:hypothetical protein BGZ98_008687 [Dissophora globulifera]|nr:hypothetical protein BGZ98_008687 [Dissophora globulifera]
MSVLAKAPARLLNAAALNVHTARLPAASLSPSSLYLRRAAPLATRAFSSNKDRPDTSSPDTTQNASPSSDSSSSSPGKPLGKVSGIVNSILHGSGSLPKVQMQSQESWGVSLARGKYVHELQRHRIRPERFDDYVQLLSEAFPRMVKESNNKMRLTGSWLTEIGELDTAVHIWEFEGYTGHAREMDRLRRDPAYQKFLKELRPMLLSRDNQICLEFAFWESRPPVALGGIYEMRTYLLKPGNLLEWETNWRRGLECRRQFCEPVGAWFSQLGKLNYVHHMWNYPDLETRKKTREQAWKVDGWAETVYNTVRLIENMEANILLPMDFSSLK